MDISWMPQLGAAVAVLVTFTLLTRWITRLEMVVGRLLHHCKIDADGNPKDDYERPSDVVRRVVREGMEDGSINFEDRRGRGA